MGKPKKGKRTGKDEDFDDSDVEIEEQSQPELAKAKSKAKDKKKKKGEEFDDLIDDFEELKVDKTKGKKGKKGKRGDDDSDDESVSIASKGKGRNQESDSEAEMKSRGKNKKGKKGSAAVEADSDSEDDAPKVKAKGKKKKGKRADDSDDESEPEMIKVKGKNKKGKRGDDDDEEEVVVKETKGKKKGKKKDEDTEEDVPKPKGKTKKGRKDDVSDEDDDIPITASKSKGKPARSGFALLDIEGDNDDDDEVEEPPPSDDESEKMQSIERPKAKQSQQKQEPQGKKGKKKKKKDDSDDEIEKALAELEMEYSGKKAEKKETEEIPISSAEPVKDEKIKKGKKEKSDKSEQRADSESKDDVNEGEEGSTVKTAAQKKKEKKERERLKKLAQKKAEGKQEDEASKEGSVEKAQEKPEASEKPEELDGDDEEDGKKKKKKGAKEDPKDKGKGPGKKMIAAMQEALKKLKEDEERAKREEEERILQEEAREKARLEQLQLEQERKEKKKLKEKQRKERLKAEGKLLTNKQKQDRARAQAMLEALKAQGMEIPEAGEKKPKTKLGTRIRPNKLKQQTSTEEKEEKKDERKPEQVEVEIVDEQVKIDEKKLGDEVKDTWDADSSEGEQEEDKSDEATKSDESKNQDKKEEKGTDKKESSDSESESGSETESEEEEESEEDSVDDKLTDAEKKREKARLRIQNRRIEAEKKKSLDNLRAAVVCVLGHVDTGKTKILDKLRRTNVQDGEAGGITQQIGATNVPIEAIQDSTRHVKDFADKVFRIPGLLIIDTPGHESFSNLRNRGSSLCDIAVLVVDIMHGLEPQTIESIGLLKTKKCPFIVALNKIDRLYDWQTMNRKDVHDIIKTQGSNTQREFEKRSKDVILQFAEQGLNAALFYENPDPRSYVSLVPTSAITGEGMGNLLALLVDACQGPLAKRLMYSEELQATVLEVKALPGLGTTIDCILVNGTLREGDTMIVAGTDGPIVTQIRSLLMPQPLKELRVKNAYKEHREVKAAQGVKIAAKDLEKAIAGLNLAVAQKPDEVELMKEEIAKELSKALGNIKLAERGVFVQASTLGALEALLDFLKTSKIPYAGIRIGPVVKKDVMKASIMLEHDSQYATILAFDVKIERDAQELADSLGVKIFQADIIYHLFDKFTAYREELKQRKRDEHKHIAVFPCKLRVLPQYIFNSRDPIVMGVMVEAGIVKEGTPVCVPSKDFVDLGIVTSIEYNHKAVETARKGQEVCIKIEPVPGEAPKMYGRHFEDKDMIVSKITRQSIDACKDYFRDDLVKTDWQLMLELKKLFQILVDTLDCTPPPALPPRRPPWPPNSELSTATLRSIGVAAGTAFNNNNNNINNNNTSLSSTNSESCESNLSTPVTTRRIRDNNIWEGGQLKNQITKPPPPSLAPPHYPAPPRPPSRNGGDEARVARAVSGHPNGVSRGQQSPRAGWAVRAGPSSSPSSPSPPSPTPSKPPSPHNPWCDRLPSQSRNPPSSPALAQLSHTSTSTQTVQPPPSTRQVPGTAARWQERLELRGVSPLMTPTSLNPPSRPPSSASSGGSTSNLPRVHGHDHTRPLPPPRLPEQQQISTIVPITAPLTPLSTSSSFRSRLPMTPLSDSISSRTSNNDRSQIGEVTLTVPRPDVERAVNEYVETPFRQPTNTPNPKCLKNERRHHHHHLQQQQQQHLRELQQNTSHQQKSDARQPRRHQQTLLQSSPNQQPVTKQPVSFTKEPSSTIVTQISGLRQNDPSLSIMCDYCGKCKCESCREPPPLPSRWLCDNTCFCSAETALDYASCLCCVKGLFYHCGDNGSGGGDNEGGASCADEPCSCSGNRKGARWACLAALTMVLPCLLCYWPLKGCVTICETCYARHAAQGCRCDPNTRHHNNDNIVVTRDSRDPEKRLLDPVTPEL